MNSSATCLWKHIAGRVCYGAVSLRPSRVLSEDSMRSKTRLCATALALAFATPAALAQTPQAGQPRLLPSAAAAYGEYQSEVSTIRSAPLGGAAELDKALNTFGAQNPDQLSSGWIAYSAMIAAQDKDFAAAVRDIDSYYGRDRVMTGMRNDVGYARTLKGGERALQSALQANSRDAGRISSAAAFVKDQAYKLQDVAWGKTRLANASGVANGLKASAKTVRPVNEAAQKLFAGPDLGIVLSNAHGEKSVW